MSDHGHGEHGEHGKKAIANPNYNLPISIPVIVVLILAAMWFWVPTVHI